MTDDELKTFVDGIPQGELVSIGTLVEASIFRSILARRKQQVFSILKEMRVSI